MIHILLPVHNRAKVTAVFLAALARQTGADYRLVVVDDGCRDDTVARVRQAVPADRLKVLSGDGNLWWAGALQLGYAALCAEAIPDDDAVLIINDDVSFAPDFLQQGRAALAEQPGAAIQAVGHDRLTGSVDAGAVFNPLTLRFRAARPGEAPNCLSTRGLIMRAAVFKRSGGFRPRRLPHYMSDYEFTLRLRSQGVPLVCDARYRMEVRLELTGGEQYRLNGLAAFWEEAFSNRAKYNPRHISVFALMTCPPWVAPLHLLRIWLRFGLAALRAGLGGLRA